MGPKPTADESKARMEMRRAMMRPASHPVQVQEGLFIGSAAAEANQAKLKQSGVTHVLTVMGNYKLSHPSSFKYKQIEVQDEREVDLLKYCVGPQGAFAFIDSAMASGGAVLVHCRAGVSRSASVVIGWLMQHHRLTYEQAYRKLLAVRPWVCPNPGFKTQLQQFEASGYVV